MKFSPSTKCFYPDNVEYREFPVDLVEVPQSDYDTACARAPGETLDFINGRVVIVPKSPKSVGDIWVDIKAKRTSVELGGVKVGTKWYHTDDASRIKYLGLFKLAEQALAAGSVGTTVLQYGGVDIKWKTMDGTFINMTVQRAQDVYFAVFGLDMAAFAAAEAHKTAMEAAADPAAYDFSAGWPASYL